MPIATQEYLDSLPQGTRFKVGGSDYIKQKGFHLVGSRRKEGSAEEEIFVKSSITEILGREVELIEER